MRINIKIPLSLIVLCLIGAVSCDESKDYKQLAKDPAWIHMTMKELNDIMVYDVFSPPVASRVYAYPAIAAYEASLPGYPEFRSFAGQLHELNPIPAPEPETEYCWELAGLQAFMVVGKTLVFSEERMESHKEKVHEHFRDIGVPAEIVKSSIEYGNKVATHIMDWANQDNYKETRTFPKFDVLNIEGRWIPTPPAYFEPIEPHWNKIRPFVIDSAEQFIPEEPTPYNMEEGSNFYKELMEVYEVGLNLDDERKEIAQFWDCNPYVMHQVGHVMYATKKITPGGHWIGIAGIAARKARSNFMETLETYAVTAIALADAFISCWDEKYRSNLVRPETLINKHIDPEWTPLLQTPPFPEYTSGHSVISNAAAIALTELHGEPFHFKDSTELEYGLPVREFDSFIEASEEAAISRLYGGIHYMPAIENGVTQGRKLGRFIMRNINTRKETALLSE